MSEYQQQSAETLAKDLGMSVENIKLVDAYKPIIDEMAFDVEVSEMINDIKRAYKKEIELDELSIEAHEIIGGLIELVQMLYEKRANQDEK